MHEPSIGYRQEPIGADDASSDEWDDEEFEDDYDTPENLLGARQHEDVLDEYGGEEGDDIYDVPEFSPDAMDGKGQDTGPPPVPRDLKPGRLRDVHVRNEEPSCQEQYEAPQDNFRGPPAGSSGRVNVSRFPGNTSPEVEEEYLVASEIRPERPCPLPTKPKPSFKGRMTGRQQPSSPNQVTSAFESRTGHSVVNGVAAEDEDQYLAALPVTPSKPLAGVRGQTMGRESPRDHFSNKFEPEKPSVPSRNDKPSMAPRLKPTAPVMPKVGRRPVPVPVAPTEDMYEVTDTKVNSSPSHLPNNNSDVTTEECYEIAVDSLPSNRAAIPESRRPAAPPKPVPGKKPSGFKPGVDMAPSRPEVIPKPSTIKERLAMLQKQPMAQNAPPQRDRDPVAVPPEDYESMNGRQLEPPPRSSLPPKPGKRVQNVPEVPQEMYEVMDSSSKVEENKENYEIPDQSTFTEPEFYEVAGEEAPPKGKAPQRPPGRIQGSRPVPTKIPVEQENYEIPGDKCTGNTLTMQETYEIPNDQEPIPSPKRGNASISSPLTYEQEDYEVVTTNETRGTFEQEAYEEPISRSPTNMPRGGGFSRAVERSDKFTNSSVPENDDSGEDYIVPNQVSEPERTAPPIVKRTGKASEAKKEQPGNSVKAKDRTKFSQKLLKEEFTLAKKMQMELGNIFGGRAKKERGAEKLSGTGGTKAPKPPGRPQGSVAREVQREDEAVLSLDALTEAITGNQSPKSPVKSPVESKQVLPPAAEPRQSLPPPKPRHSASFEESLEEVMAHSEWYHRNIKRDKAEAKLRQLHTEGMFIVRDTEKGHGYSLSFYASGSVRHLRINLDLNTKKYQLGSYNHTFGSVVQLIKYFQENSFELKVRQGGDNNNGGLARLIMPCPQ